MATARRILGLARDVTGLLVALVGLIKLILSLVGGATNYAARCLEPTITSSLWRMGSRYLSLRHQAERRARVCMPRARAGGASRATSTNFCPAGHRPHPRRPPLNPCFSTPPT